MRNMKTRFLAGFLAIVMGIGLGVSVPAGTSKAAGKNYVVVIDPGHGGDNTGANLYGANEKDMNLVTANAMYQTLTQFENVTVHMTRTGDQSLSLDERAAIAKSLNADFLFSLHYNAAADHERYGAEVYTSVAAPYNALGYQFGVIQLAEMHAKGMFIRGVKARRADNGSDYYGVIRGATARGIPSVIIEHCHVDQTDDHNRCILPEQQQAFGVADAIAVAKYFGLRSPSLGMDFTGYPKAAVNTSAIVPATIDEMTPPDFVSLTQTASDADNGTVTFHATATDVDDAIIYYDYSLDGGVTFSTPRQPWAGADPINNSSSPSMQVVIPVTPGTNANVILRVHNMFDRTSISDPAAVSW